MLPRYIGNRDPGPRGLLHDPKLLVDGIPSTALNTRINLNTLCIRRHSRMTRLTPSSYLRQHCTVEIGAAPRSLHVELPPTRKFYFSDPHFSGGDYHPCRKRRVITSFVSICVCQDIDILGVRSQRLFGKAPREAYQPLASLKTRIS